MTNLTLRQFRYVDAVARHGHFTRAAEACAVSQPALSMQIREIEAQLGHPLFERASRGVHLTVFGAEVLRRAREILQAVDELGNMARNTESGIAGGLRLGIIPTVAPYLLPQLIATLHDARPALDLKIRESLTPHLLDELSEGRLDCAVVALPISDPTLAEFPLFSEDFVLIRPARDAGAPLPNPEQLQEMRLLLLEEGHCFRDQALSFCGAPQARPREHFDCNSLTTLVQLVAAGLGVTLLPEMAVEVETRHRDLAVDRFTAERPQRHIGLVWRRQNPLGPRLKEIGHLLQEATRAAPAPPG